MDPKTLQLTDRQTHQIESPLLCVSAVLRISNFDPCTTLSNSHPVGFSSLFHCPIQARKKKEKEKERKSKVNHSNSRGRINFLADIQFIEPNKLKKEKRK